MCTEAKRLLSVYSDAKSAFDAADRAVAMKTDERDPVYLAAWLGRKEAERALLDARKRYRAHLEKHDCGAGLFTDVA